MHKILIYLYIIHLLKSSTCFQHYPAHLQEVYVVIVYMQPLVSSLSAGDCPVHRLRKNLFLNRCTGQSPADSDDTRGCIYRCPRRKGQNFGRVFLMLKYTDITQNTCIQSWTFTEIMAREKCGLLAGLHTVPCQLTAFRMSVLDCRVCPRLPCQITEIPLTLLRQYSTMADYACHV